jgi:hypothetical protein
MSFFTPVVLLVTLAAPVAASPAAAPRSAATYVGVITDSMCNTDHQPMKVSPDSKCVRDCVGDTTTFKYALSDGKRTFLLSDQETPADFAGKKVRVTGVLYPKTNILKVERIELAK